MMDDEIFDEEDDDYVVVEMVDEEGNTYPYVQEMIIPVGNDKFALLVPLHDEEEHEHGCDCGCEDEEDDVIIAKMVENEDGEVEYIEPTDEEFKLVEEAYDSIFDEEDE